MAKNAPKLSTMVVENFEIYLPKWQKNVLNNPPWLDKILKFAYLKWLKTALNNPPWLEKILKFAYLKWLILLSNLLFYIEYFHATCDNWPTVIFQGFQGSVFFRVFQRSVATLLQGFVDTIIYLVDI